MKEEKILGENRRNFILKLLRDNNGPITGSELSTYTNVSRQVIVQDVSLLKARNEPIIATSQGYLYLNQAKKESFERVVACYHSPDQTLEELTIIVDHGVTIKDVIIEHPVYGDLKAAIMVSNRKEAEQLVNRILETKASYLLELTDGTHLHTLEADSTSKLDAAYKSLYEAGYIIK